MFSLAIPSKTSAIGIATASTARTKLSEFVHLLRVIKLNEVVSAGSSIKSIFFDSERPMSIPENEKRNSAELTDASLPQNDDISGADEGATTSHPSEVTMRINILGKLIVPPSEP
jgi:hypothetical protein